MKTAETQAEDQRKQLYTTQINLATEKAAVIDLKAELQKAQEALKVAQEVAKAAEAAAYEREVLEMEARLTAELKVAGIIALKITSKPLIEQESLRTLI